MLGADKAKLESLVSDQLSYGHSGGVIQDKKDFVEVIASKKSVYKSIELRKQTVAVAGNNAIVRHAWESESGTGDGKWNVSKIGVLQVWQKEPGGWKLLARQAFKVELAHTLKRRARGARRAPSRRSARSAEAQGARSAPCARS